MTRIAAAIFASLGSSSPTGDAIKAAALGDRGRARETAGNRDRAGAMKRENGDGDGDRTQRSIFWSVVRIALQGDRTVRKMAEIERVERTRPSKILLFSEFIIERYISQKM